MVAAKKRSKRKVMTQPATVAGAGVSLTSLVTFLPAQWQGYGYAAAAVLGLVVPLVASRQQRAGD